MDQPKSETTARLELAVEIAREAGLLTLEYFNQDNYRVERKADDSPVTIADRRAEELLRNRIADVFPADAILGEELDDRAGTSGYRWIVDPIDGTKSFIHGVPIYATLVAIEHQGKSMAGVIRIPALNEAVFAAVGHGAWHVVGDALPRRARVSECSRLAEGLFLTSEVKTFDEAGRRDAYDRLQSAARLSRTWGDAYGYLLVATGRAELMADAIMEPWDAGPLPPILTEAGGTFTDWQGQTTIYSRQGVATNGRVLDETLALLR
ncbi:MAG TPA: histidinol-phosphatase [Planctomycetaceae bacterium]|nr:histidinol-phosphatase [Planctomycetaceae bacterium]